MHKVRAEDRDVLLEPRQYRLTDAKRLHGAFVGTGQRCSSCCAVMPNKSRKICGSVKFMGITPSKKISA